VGIAGALGIASCGSSSSHATTNASTSSATTATGSTGAATATTATPATAPSGGKPTIAAKVCSLLTPSQVQALMGAPAAQAGTENDYDTNYKTCSWTTGNSSGNATTARLAVVMKANASDNGFSAPASAGPVPVSGVGDNATFATSGGGAGQFGQSILVANKGLTSVSLAVNYGGSVAHPASTQAAFGEDVREVFTQLGG
jgi:hypothetical protein